MPPKRASSRTASRGLGPVASSDASPSGLRTRGGDPATRTGLLSAGAQGFSTAYGAANPLEGERTFQRGTQDVGSALERMVHTIQQDERNDARRRAEREAEEARKRREADKSRRMSEEEEEARRELEETLRLREEEAARLRREEEETRRRRSESTQRQPRRVGRPRKTATPAIEEEQVDLITSPDSRIPRENLRYTQTNRKSKPPTLAWDHHLILLQVQQH